MEFKRRQAPCAGPLDQSRLSCPGGGEESAMLAGGSHGIADEILHGFTARERVAARPDARYLKISPWSLRVA
jgi:hypothetical protein